MFRLTNRTLRVSKNVRFFLPDHFFPVQQNDFLTVINHTKQAIQRQKPLEAAAHIETADKIYHRFSVERWKNSAHNTSSLQEAIQFFIQQREQFRQDEKGSAEVIKNRIAELIKQAKQASDDGFIRKYYFTKAIRMLSSIPQEQLKTQDESLVNDVLLGEIVLFDGSQEEFDRIKEDYQWFTEKYPLSRYSRELKNAVESLSDGVPIHFFSST